MIESGTGVALSRGLSDIPVGTVSGSRERSTFGRKRTQYRISWNAQNFGSVPLPEWVDESDLVIVPDVTEPGIMPRTIPSVVVESIARDFESGAFDDADASPEGIARAIRERYLGN